MLSVRIKEKIEKEFGKGPIRYPKDCDALAHDISSRCNCKISSSTLKRLFGIIKNGTESPRACTLDILANYIGHSCWEDFLLEITKAGKIKSKPLQTLEPKGLYKGSKFHISFGTVSYVVIECIGKNHFKLLLQNKTSLLPDDILEIIKVQTHDPLVINKIIRNDIVHSEIILGKLTGITEIKKYSSNLKSK